MKTQNHKYGAKKIGKRCYMPFIFLPLALALTMACLCGCSEPENTVKKIDQDQAWEIVKKNILNDNPGKSIVYRSKDLLNAGQEVKSWQQVYTVPNDFKKAWLFFVDDQPDANWGHNSRYIFVDSESGKYHVINSLTPPDSIDEMTKIFPPPENG